MFNNYEKIFIDQDNTEHLWSYCSIFTFRITCIILIYQVGSKTEKNKLMDAMNTHLIT